MSTTPVETWAVDLTSLGPVYPFVGSETIMLVIGVVLWLAFHVIQIAQENRVLNEEASRLKDPKRLEEAMKLTNGH